MWKVNRMSEDRIQGTERKRGSKTVMDKLRVTDWDVEGKLVEGTSLLGR